MAGTADFKISVSLDAKDTEAGAAEARRAIKSIGDEVDKTAKRTKSLASPNVDELKGQLDAASVSAGGLRSSVASAAAGMGPFGIAVAAVAVAIAALGLAVYQIAKYAFELSRQFANYTIELRNTAEAMGLTMKATQALRHEFEAQGRSFNDLQSGMQNFRKTIGEAAAGSEEARNALKSLGLDAKTAMNNIDGAFKTAVAAIVSAKTPVEQARLALAAFGDEGYKLIPFLKEFGGNVDALTAKAEELGLTVGDTRAAEEFKRTYADVEVQFQIFQRTLAMTVLPVVNQFFREFSTWLGNNKVTVTEWATSLGNAINGVLTAFRELAAFVTDHPYIFRFALASATWGLSEAAIGTYKSLEQLGQQAAPSRSAIPNYDPSLNPQGPLNADPYALQAMLAYRPKKQRAPRIPRQSLPQLTDEQRQAQDLTKIITDLNGQIAFYGQKTQEAAMRQRLLSMNVKDGNQYLADQAIQLAKVIDQKAKDAEADKNREEFLKRVADIDSGIANEAFMNRVGIGEQIQASQMQLTLGRDLNLVDKQRISDTAELIRKTREWETTVGDSTKIDELKAQLLTEQEETMKRIVTLQENLNRLNQERVNSDLMKGLSDEIADLNQRLRENAGATAMTRVEQLQLSEAYKQLTPEMQKARIEQAQQIDALRETLKAQQEAQRQYDELHNAIRESLGILADQGFGAFFKSIYRRFKQWLLDLAAEWLTSKFFKLLSGVGGAQQGQGSGGGTGGLQSIFQTIFGGGRGSSSSSGAGGGWGSPGSGSSVPSLGSPASGGSSSSSGGFAGHAMPGYVSAISAGGGILGGMIGGTWGNVISMASTGLGIGWMIGGPIGGAIGAGVGALGGFLASLFGGDPKRKKDKKENLPALQKGFLEAIADLERLKNDRMAIYNDPDGTLSRARDIRTQIAAGFGIEFLSKKYRKIAQQQISQKLIEADKLIAELEQIAGTYKYARQVDERIVTSFAGGVFMSPAFMKQFGDFKRRNGFLGGRFTGSDTLPSMLAPGEMVLNPYQVGRVKANAGMDPFARAGIPGYTTGAVVSSAPQPMTAANMGGQIVVQPQISVTIEGEGITDARIKSVVVDGVKDPDFQVELVRAYDKGKTRGTRGY